MMDEERKWLELVQSLAVEVTVARTDGERRHFVRMLEMACQGWRTRVWGEPADVSEAVNLAASTSL